MNNGKIHKEKINTKKKLSFNTLNKKTEFQRSAEKVNLQKGRWHSSKLVVNFVPKLKPKKSFCKPTHFQLDDSEEKEEKKEKEQSLDLNIISSCDEGNSNDSSSNISSENEENDSDSEKEFEENHEDNDNDNEITSSAKNELNNNEYKGVKLKQNKKYKLDIYDKENEEKNNVISHKKENSSESDKIHQNIQDKNSFQDKETINTKNDFSLNENITILDIISIKDKKKEK